MVTALWVFMSTTTADTGTNPTAGGPLCGLFRLTPLILIHGNFPSNASLLIGKDSFAPDLQVIQETCHLEFSTIAPAGGTPAPSWLLVFLPVWTYNLGR